MTLALAEKVTGCGYCETLYIARICIYIYTHSAQLFDNFPLFFPPSTFKKTLFLRIKIFILSGKHANPISNTDYCFSKEISRSVNASKSSFFLARSYGRDKHSWKHCFRKKKKKKRKARSQTWLSEDGEPNVQTVCPVFEVEFIEPLGCKGLIVCMGYRTCRTFANDHWSVTPARLHVI